MSASGGMARRILTIVSWREVIPSGYGGGGGGGGGGSTGDGFKKPGGVFKRAMSQIN